MRKQIYGRKFKRDKNQRKALFQGLISAMILKGKIATTEQKAKAIKGDLEKLVTKAKKGEKEARRLLQAELKPFEIEKMVSQIAPGFKNRAGGYTRIIKTGSRFNDNASMVIMQWSDMEEIVVPAKAEVKTVKKSASKSLSRVRKTARPRSAKVSRGKKESK